MERIYPATERRCLQGQTALEYLMKLISRRDAFKGALLGAISMQFVDETRPAIAGSSADLAPKPAVGIEGQRRADLGDGTYLNPIVAGDHPDPTVLKDGDDYYMTFSSFFSYPGVIIWHSRDLVNWAPVGPALTKPIGTVWAMDLIKHEGRYFIYIPASPAAGSRSLSSMPTIFAALGAIRLT
jgi:xylan 1,4-beta-xylosidase